MNYLTIFFYYFTEQRFSEILDYFGINKNNRKKRKELITQLLEHDNFQVDLLKEFLFKAELQNFCKSAGISKCSGSKKEIFERIVLFLKNIDLSTVKISMFNQYTEISFVIENKESRIKDSSEMLKFNALIIAHRLVDYWKYDKNEEKAIKALRSLHPELPLDICTEMFTYALNAYREAIEIVEENRAVYYKNLNKLGTKEWEALPCEVAFLKKYKKLNKNQLWIFEQIFFWHHLK